LRDRKGRAGDQDGRPNLSCAPGRERPHHPERHDQREQRQLPADHRAEDIGIEPGDRGKALDRRAERAEGDGCGVGDQRQAGGGEREKPSPISTEPVIATGVPKPEAPSKKAPNEKAISSSCRRRSS